MSVDGCYALTELELDALKEILNVSFGSAVADLSELMDIFITLSLPEVHIQDLKKFSLLLEMEENSFNESRVIYQKFYGQFEGYAFLVFPYGKEKALLSYFQNPDYTGFESDELIELEMEALMEIGSILTGACIGKIFDFLNSSLIYLPPLSAKGEELSRLLPGNIHKPHKEAIIMKTGFSFEDRQTRGTLVILTYEESIPYLKKALSHFLE